MIYERCQMEIHHNQSSSRILGQGKELQTHQQTVQDETLPLQSAAAAPPQQHDCCICVTRYPERGGRVHGLPLDHVDHHAECSEGPWLCVA